MVFLSGSLLALYLSFQPASQESIANRITHRLNSQLEALDKEGQLIILEWKKYSRTPFQSYEDFSFFLVTNTRVLRWSDNVFVPTPASVQGDFTVKLLKEGNSSYIARKWRIDDQQFLVGIISLSRNYNITNKYLKPEWNSKIFPQGDVDLIDPSSTEGELICWRENCPFKIKFNPAELHHRQGLSVVAVVLIFGTVIFFLISLFEFLKPKLIPDFIFLILLATLFATRLAMTSLDFPARLIAGDLFDPAVFASSNLNASLGDLLLNEITLFIVCVYLFKNLFHFRAVKFLQGSIVTARILSGLSGFLMMLAMLYPFVVIQTLYNNSAITISISESLKFDSLRIAATLIILLSGICSFLFAHSFIRLLIGDGNKLRMFISFLGGIALFIVFNLLNQQFFLSSLITGVMYFALVYGLNLYGSLRKLTFTTFTYLFVTISCISLNGAYSIYHYGTRDKFENQFRFARNFLIDRDYFGEYLLGELSRKISRDQFIQKRVGNPFFSKDAVRQKIRQLFIPSYFNKYDVEIFVFNASGELVEGRSGITFPSLVANYDYESFRTDYKGVYFISSPDADITQKYLVVVPIRSMKSLSGHVVIEFSLKKIIPENVYPELLVDNRFLQFYRSREISYGVYVNGDLSYSAGNFNYEGLFNKAWFGNPELHTVGITRDGYDHIAEEDENGRVAVVSSKSPTLTLQFANFSFLLVLGLTTILVFILVQGLLNFWEGGKLYFSARIQLFLNLAFFLPLIIVSVMSLRVTNRSSQNQINDEYLDKTKKFSEQLSSELHRSLTTLFEGSSSFENNLTDLAQLSNLEANVYSSSGLLFASSQPLIFENNLLSTYVNPKAFKKIQNGQNLFIEHERVGSLEYYTAFASLKAPSSGALIGIVSVPFFQSLYSLEKVQINILANILNIFSVIFIVLVALSYFITQWITFPLTFITQTLRKTSLTKTNQPLVWKTDDEIGLMVKEYNQMLFSLSESKAELEQTQRETAWREIAQQVAHEIKNPLTPMKLTLQQLERAVEAGTAGPEKTQKAVSSLLTQVNTLNDIASSFSSFAKMPEPVMKPLEIVSLLKRIVDLHSHSGDIRFDGSTRDFHILGDEQLLGRTFSNIILNAIQAAKPGEVSVVRVKADTNSGNVLLSFQDNGKGIHPEIVEQIFVPHFTTKKSGSGIGLAIAKQAIEQMKGRLWFETYPGKGTTFFIELPLNTEYEGK
jgi:two-component system, NtrC family, nitrogen regulation sensor histidine kinase NtrY